MPGALSHIKVIDLTSNLSGPYCAMLLADQGADVIKVERKGAGDSLRETPPFVGGESAPFMLWNRNKRSIELDLKDPADLEVCRRLAAEADVFIENYRPGVAERLGLGYEALAALNPGLVYCSISGFGQTGPYAPRGGFDLIAQAMSGLMAISGDEDGPPHRLPIAISDTSAGMFAAVGVLSALAARGETGRGQQVDVSLYESAISKCVYEAAYYFATDERPAKLGQQHRGSSPYQVFQTQDGWLVLGAAQQNLWQKACKVLDVEHLVDDPRFKTKADRVANNKALVGLLQERFATATNQEWFEKLDAVGIPAGPVQYHDEVFQDPHVLAREMVVEVDHPTAGRQRNLGTPIKLSATPGSVRRPAPLLGEHSEEIRAELAARGKAAE
ncbi:MAG: CoA transferase [Alphaproteobacteria bacterium]|jgi:crotonobetainyl-CoA:carnitine CoA-transferase CaiB-like acyl-CoA transferase|nr:CoA transferase [Alphaproteobacteria bacterium]